MRRRHAGQRDSSAGRAEPARTPASQTRRSSRCQCSTYTARALNGELQNGDDRRRQPSDEVSRASCGRAADRRQESTRRPSKIKLSMGERQDQDARHRHLHPSVLDDDQRRSAAGAGAQHSGDADREQGARRTSPGRSCSTSSRATPWPTRSRKHPKAFTDLYVNMVAAGEAGGILDTILHAPRDVPGKERRPRPQGEGRHDLPGRHHERGRRSPSRCCSSSSSRRSRTCSRRAGHRAAAADPHRDRDVAAS